MKHLVEEWDNYRTQIKGTQSHSMRTLVVNYPDNRSCFSLVQCITIHIVAYLRSIRSHKIPRFYYHILLTIPTKPNISNCHYLSPAIRINCNNIHYDGSLCDQWTRFLQHHHPRNGPLQTCSSQDNTQDLSINVIPSSSRTKTQILFWNH